jgi:hypothetical protein
VGHASFGSSLDLGAPGRRLTWVHQTYALQRDAEKKTEREAALLRAQTLELEVQSRTTNPPRKCKYSQGEMRSWEDHFALVTQYHDKEGKWHGQSLGLWVKTQRKRHKEGALGLGAQAG